ncbi:acyltransferase [Sphingomonas sp. BGYR3]|uniref:acyltransferase family protein n=1 Tax=Sphingomonas sp. BGYR3 TaxID=2975483 RepID=UPI0021A8480F|nr:acyltransferase [Sphingomonas sp. BGYR3]MDG5488157.1 acyltransferase [Sphingomonas sp. BGYR3]
MTGAAPRPRFSNFDWLRLVAASAVIFSHSFPIAEDSEVNEPFVRYLDAPILGLFGVAMFFAMSGFLIAQSAGFNPSWRAFLLNRALRIYPALLVVLVLTAFVVAPFFHARGAMGFLTSTIPFRYVAKGLLLLDGLLLSGLQFYPGDYGWVVNGSMWTILYEIACYVAIALLMMLGIMRLWAVLAIGLGTVLVVPLLMSPWVGLAEARIVLLVVPAFFAGAAIHFLLRGRPAYPAWPIALCAMLAVVGFRIGLPLETFGLWGAYPLIWIATHPRWQLPGLDRFGDISYGMYLYGWPVQQVWRVLLGEGATWQAVFMLSLPTAALFGYASWHLIERRALAFKARARRPDGITAPPVRWRRWRAG